MKMAPSDVFIGAFLVAVAFVAAAALTGIFFGIAFIVGRSLI